VITFIEKESFNTNIHPDISRRLIPVYMIKDGLEYFVMNRNADIPDDGSLWAEQQNAVFKMAKSMLFSNGGMCFKFYGRYDSAYEMIRIMKIYEFTFTNPEGVFKRCGDGYSAAFVDFSGNFNEYSSAFHYRIYDEEMVRQLKAEINR